MPSWKKGTDNHWIEYLLICLSRHNNGHITRAQFRQCMTMLELFVTEPEMQTLEAKFCNDTGFNYLAFLSELQPAEPPKMMYAQRLEDLRKSNTKGKLPEVNIATDLEGILVKIKTKASIICRYHKRYGTVCSSILR